jgi:hypothetical protein
LAKAALRLVFAEGEEQNSLGVGVQLAKLALEVDAADCGGVRTAAFYLWSFGCPLFDLGDRGGRAVTTRHFTLEPAFGKRQAKLEEEEPVDKPPAIRSVSID